MCLFKFRPTGPGYKVITLQECETVEKWREIIHGRFFDVLKTFVKDVFTKPKKNLH